MATELDGSALRRAYKETLNTLKLAGQKVVNLMAMHVVLVFGFLGSPGEWVVWAWALAQAFNTHTLTACACERRRRMRRRHVPRRFRLLLEGDACEQVGV